MISLEGESDSYFLDRRDVIVFAGIMVEISHDASSQNKARYMATEVACGKAGAIFEVTRPFGLEQLGQRNQIMK